VLLSGEAGIGKSRLTAALMEHLDAEPHTRLRYFCSPQHTDSAFYPIIGQMERHAGLAHDDQPQTKLDKVDATLAQSSTQSQRAAMRRRPYHFRGNRPTSLRFNKCRCYPNHPEIDIIAEHSALLSAWAGQSVPHRRNLNWRIRIFVDDNT
jgi:hypothetical protein